MRRSVMPRSHVVCHSLRLKPWPPPRPMVGEYKAKVKKLRKAAHLWPPFPAWTLFLPAAMIAVVIVMIAVTRVPPPIATVAIDIAVFVAQLTSFALGAAIISLALIAPQLPPVVIYFALVAAYVTIILAPVTIIAIVAPFLRARGEGGTAQHAHRQYSHQNLFHVPLLLRAFLACTYKPESARQLR